jgi:hypothetical protein
VLALSCVIRWTQIAGELARLAAESPLTGFIEEHIVHRTFNPANLVKNWTNMIRALAGTAILLALFFMVMTRDALVPRFKAIYNSGRRLYASGLFDSLERRLANRLFLFMVCGCLGAIFFIQTFGTAILDGSYADWLMSGWDLSQHYLGWRMFRESAWHFPIGLMDNIVYPFKESIIYTDSIPLFAVFFKVLSPILPQNFQYFGLFGLVIYFLQGAVAALVIQKLCNNSFFSILGSVFFMFSSVMMQRIYGHTSLAAHFIILLCIYACITREGGRTLRENIILWGALFCLAVSIHLYFVPVVFICMIVRCVKDFLERGRIRDIIIACAACLIILTAAMFVLGAFYSHADYSGALLGDASMNINALFNPQGFRVDGSEPFVTSRFLQPLPLAAFFQYEGYGYLGFGILLACFFFSCLAFKNSLKIREVLRNTAYRRNVVLTAALFLFFTIFALSPVVTFNGKELFRYYIPGVNSLWAIFRSTGRYVWVLMYIIMFVVLWAIKKQFGAKKGFLLACVFLAFQYVDLKMYFYHKGEPFKQRTVWESPLASKEWTDIAAHKKHIFFVEGTSWLYPLMDFALTHHLTTNDSYLARTNTKRIQRYKDEEKSRILAGRADAQTLYIFETEDEAEKYKTALDIAILDSVIAGIKK